MMYIVEIISFSIKKKKMSKFSSWQINTLDFEQYSIAVASYLSKENVTIKSLTRYSALLSYKFITLKYSKV